MSDFWQVISLWIIGALFVMIVTASIYLAIADNNEEASEKLETALLVKDVQHISSSTFAYCSADGSIVDGSIIENQCLSQYCRDMGMIYDDLTWCISEEECYHRDGIVLDEAYTRCEYGAMQILSEKED